MKLNYFVDTAYCFVRVVAMICKKNFCTYQFLGLITSILIRKLFGYIIIQYVITITKELVCKRLIFKRQRFSVCIIYHFESTCLICFYSYRAPYKSMSTNELKTDIYRLDNAKPFVKRYVRTNVLFNGLSSSCYLLVCTFIGVILQ